MSAVLTRRMRGSDVDTVARLEREIFPDPWAASAFRHETEGEEGSWPRVAVDAANGEILAYMVAWFVADEAHLANVAVAPWARRRGLAQRLVAELLEEARRRKVRLVLLEVRRSNTAAQALYRNNGFYTIDVRAGYYRDNREDALVMIKPMNDAGRIPPREGEDA